MSGVLIPSHEDNAATGFRGQDVGRLGVSVGVGGCRNTGRLLSSLLTAMLVLVTMSAGLVVGKSSGQSERCGDALPVTVPATPATATHDSGLIAAENAQPGATGWMIPQGHAAVAQIQGYASAESACPGQKLTFYVSTEVAGTPYSVDIYRLGWYAGLGGRLMTSFNELGQAQGYYRAQSHRLIGCASCTFDRVTHLVEANWQPSFTLRIGADWTTGLYVAKLTDAHDWQAYVSFEVRGNLDSAYVVVVPDTTTAAYNDWGGYSLYHGPNGALRSRATVVSFDRPAPGWRYGLGNGLPYEIDAIRWMERSGYDLSYISSVDLDQDPGQLLKHRAYLSIGHDEYWSEAVRDGIERARDFGVGLAFLGANAGYWRVRYAPDAQGVADRRVICYKDPQRDPLFGIDNSRVTGTFRDPPISRPENALVGIMYVGWISAPGGFGWHFSPASDDSPLIQGTGLRPGERYGCNIVGYEFDSVVSNGATPRDLRVLATTRTHSDDGHAETSSTAYYVADSGALVFASGSIYWSYALDTRHIWDVPSVSPALKCLAAAQGRAIPGIQKLMANVMAALIVRHDGTAWR